MPDVANAILANAKEGEKGGIFGVLAGAAVGFATTRIGTPKPPAPWYKQPRNLEIGGVVIAIIVLVVLIKGKR
jgi:hypothetical protein